MKGKIFTAEEVDKMLPLIVPIVDDLVATYGEVNKALVAYEEVRARAEANKPGGDRIRVIQVDGEVAVALERFQGLIEEIGSLGGTVKDYEVGSIDFYGEVAGEIVYFCWQRGEPRIAHWHRLEEGLRKRKPLPPRSSTTTRIA
jgi:hypothetical protein